MGGPMLCHVLTTQQSAGKTTNQVPKNKKGSQKEKKECGLNCYLDTYPSRPARQLEDRKKSRACLHKELQLVYTLRTELWFHVTKHRSSTARAKNLTRTKPVASGKFIL